VVVNMVEGSLPGAQGFFLVILECNISAVWPLVRLQRFVDTDLAFEVNGSGAG
jgi:hypothetical protein